MYNMAKIHVGFKAFQAPGLWAERWFAAKNPFRTALYGKELRMSDTVVFTKRGLKALYWNDETRQFDEHQMEFALMHLNDLCVIEPGTTLGQIFAAVEKHEDLVAVVSFYSTCPEMKAFLIQARQPYEQPAKPELVFDHIEIFKEVNVSKGYFDVFTDWHAAFRIEDDTDEGWHTEYATLSYEPMNSIAHLPVQIVEEIVVREHGGDKIEGNVIRPGMKTTFTLLEVLHAIFDDISWHGGPEGNAAFKDEQNQEREKFEEELKNGTLKTTPSKQVFENIRQMVREREANPTEQDGWKDETLADAVLRNARECNIPRVIRHLRGKARYDKLEEMWAEGIIATGEYNHIKDVLDGKDVPAPLGIVGLAIAQAETRSGEQQ